ncbi:MAG: preprotein translocase subunit SecG [Phycisphaerae bacterium]
MDIFLGILFVIICVLLILVILLQKGKGGGLGAAFGGAGGGSAFGTRTGDVLTWVTILLTGAFLALAIGANLAFRTDPGVVATPDFSPSQIDPVTNPDADPVQVTIRSQTPTATIYYTLDGTEPDRDGKTSMEYKAKPIALKPGQTLRARAYRSQWTSSGINTLKYELLTTQPATGPTTQETPATGPAATTQTVPAG